VAAIIGDLPWVLDYAVQAGAHLVELPNGWQTLDTAAHLHAVQDALEAN
jgi:hypothetical protein